MKKKSRKRGRRLSGLSQQQVLSIEAIKSLQCGFIKCECDDWWTVLRANDKFYELIGYSPDEFKTQLGGKMINLLDPDLRDKVREELSEQLSQSRQGSIQYRINNASGMKRTIIDSYILVNEHGTDYVYCTYTDITEQLLFASKREEWKDKLIHTVDSSDLYFWEYGVQENCLYNGYKSVRDFGMPEYMSDFPESFINAGYIHPDSIDDFRELHEDIKRGMKSSERHIRLAYPDERALWHNVKYTNFYDDDGKPGIAFATAQNLDDYKDLEQQFELLTKQANLHTWTLDMQNKVLYNYDSELKKFLIDDVVFDPSKYIEKKNIIYRDDIRLFKHFVRKLYSGEDSPSQELRFILPDTQIAAWVRLTSAVIRNKSGKPVKALGAIQDISAQKAAEEKFTAFRSFGRFAEKNTISVFKMNLTKDIYEGDDWQNIEDVNVAAGSRVDDFFEYVYERLPDEEEIAVYKTVFTRSRLLELFKDGRELPEVEHRCYLNDGRPIWIRTVAEMIENPSTRDVEARIYAIDIDHEKVKKTVLNTVMDIDYEFIAVLDLIKGSFEIIGNSSGYELQPVYEGTEQYDILSAKYTETFVVEEDRELYRSINNTESIAKILAEKKYYSHTYRVAWTDGKVHVKRSVFVYVDETRRIVGITRKDVTREYREQQEKTNILSDALKAARKANEAKSMFLSNMSHDIRTPMNAIINMARFSLDEINDTSKVKENIEVIINSSQHLLKLINNVLDMSRIESGDITMSVDSFNIEEDCCSVEQIIRPLCESRKQHFITDFSKITGKRVRGDSLKINQIFINLLNNAMKYTPDGGTISFSAAERKSLDPNTINVRFEIKDNGIGIPKEKQSEIFEPFKRAEFDYNKYTAEGSGLGLSIARSYIDAMNGKISVVSTPGKGSLFTVDIPFILEEPKTDDADISTDGKMCMCFSGKTVLVVEDNEINQIVAQKMLKNECFEVDTALNGQEGIDKFLKSEAGKYDVILMDVKMPVVDGYEATKAIRASDHPQARTIPIIATTANVFAEDVNEAVRNGMTDHVAKPLNAEQLFGTISKYV